MPVTLRKRLACHYCGKRLNAAATGTATTRAGNQIKCEFCLADNHFDAHNNFIDVPVAVASESSRASGPEVESQSSVFCKTCLNNQAYYVNALANYLPDDDDPRYDELERALPSYERELDLRYPRCCARCEPRVQAQIQHANYAAKSDHLRRLMHRKHRRRKTIALQTKSLLISAAGLGQACSLLAQLLWHAASSQAQPDQPISLITPRQCFVQWPLPPHCASYAASWLPLSLALGLLTIWWNPKWQHRLLGRDGRLSGLSHYYLLQILVMAARVALWLTLDDVAALQNLGPALHTMCLALLMMTSTYTYFGVIHVDTTPLVDWSRVQRPLISPGQYQPPLEPTASLPSSQTGPLFSIDNLAGSQPGMHQPWRPPTPPVTEDDTMDWAPTRQSFEPRPKYQPPKLDQPSPFHGTLPAAPARGSLNPNRQAPPPQRKALGLPPGFFGLSKSRNQPQQSTSSNEEEGIVFAPAKFFGHDRVADTGLESIFDRAFSVNDPTGAQSPRRSAVAPPVHHTTGLAHNRGSRQALPPTVNQPPLRLFICCTFVVALAVLATSLCSLEYMFSEVQPTPSMILPYLSALPLTHIIEEFAYTDGLHWTDVALPFTESLLSASAYFLLPADDSPMVPTWNKAVISVVVLFLLQEIYQFCQLQSSPVSHAAAAQMFQSIKQAEQQSPPDAQIHIQSLLSHPSSSPPSQPIAPHEPHYSLNHAPPSQTSPFLPYPNPSPLRNRDSDESISSISSIQTTSTAPGWKTPKSEQRSFDWDNSSSHNSNGDARRRPSSSIARGLGGLRLSNDFGIGSGSGIAGPRTRNGGRY